jgi:hypothetical protein
MRFKALNVMKISMLVLWVATPCRLYVDINAVVKYTASIIRAQPPEDRNRANPKNLVRMYIKWTMSSTTARSQIFGKIIFAKIHRRD